MSLHISHILYSDLSNCFRHSSTVIKRCFYVTKHMENICTPAYSQHKALCQHVLDYSRVFWIQSKFTFPIKSSSRVHKWDRDVSDPLYGGQTLVVVSEASGVHERPAPPGSFNGAVVPQEPAAAALNRESLIVNTAGSCSVKPLQNSRHIFKGKGFTLQA